MSHPFFYKISTLDTLLGQFLLLVIVGARDVCNGYNIHPYVSTCQKVFKELEKTLIEDETNLYSLKGIFFYAPSADPVNYSGDDITEKLLPYCDGTDNSTTINITQTAAIHGWTSSGVYYVMSPLVLNKMQMPLPLIL